MNRYQLPVALLTGWMLLSCGQDSTEKAKTINEKKIDAQAASITDDAKADAKEVVDHVIDLFSMGMTEYELSKIALKKATNPEVRSYAQRAMNQHQQDEKELRDVARQMSVTLPTALADDGQDRVDDLADESAGTAFDLQYLKEMASLNNEAIDIADDLADEAPNDAVRKLARKIKADDRQHEEQARQLRNVLN